MDRQLKGQEQGLNDMSVEEYLEARKAFDPKNRDKTVAEAARKQYKRDILERKENELKDLGIDRKTRKEMAAEHADETMKVMHALHNPDLVAGGSDKIADFGDGQVNSTIGRQWKHAKKGQASRIDELDEAAANVPVSERNKTKMNGGLERCR
jgi:hypothetical protein